MTKALKNHINCSEMLNAIQERKRCNRLVIILWRNIILIGDHFGVDLGIISEGCTQLPIFMFVLRWNYTATKLQTYLTRLLRVIWRLQTEMSVLLIAFIYTPLLLYHLNPNRNILRETLFSTRVFFSCFGTVYAPQMFFNLSWKRYLQNIYKGKQLITK